MFTFDKVLNFIFFLHIEHLASSVHIILIYFAVIIDESWPEQVDDGHLLSVIIFSNRFTSTTT